MALYLVITLPITTDSSNLDPLDDSVLISRKFTPLPFIDQHHHGLLALRFTLPNIIELSKVYNVFIGNDGGGQSQLLSPLLIICVDIHWYPPTPTPLSPLNYDYPQELCDQPHWKYV